MSLTFLRGFDGGCELSCYCKVSFSLRRYLAEVKQTAAAMESRYNTEYNGVLFQVLPSGVIHRREGAERGVRYDYQLFLLGTYVLIRGKDSSGFPSIRLKFTYESLRDCDLFAKWEQVKSVLEFWGVEFEECRVGRVDFQVTTNKFTVQDVAKAFNEDRLILNGRLFAFYGKGVRSPESCYIGKDSELEICVYNKSREMSIHWDSQKARDCCEVLGVQEVPDNLTRVEVRFRRDFLRRKGITTIEELRDHFDWLLKSTMERNFRILEKPKVRGYEFKQKTSDLYNLVMSLMFGSEVPIKPLPAASGKKRTPLPSRYFRTAIGYLTSGLSIEFGREIADRIRSGKRAKKFVNEDRVDRDVVQEIGLSTFGLYHKYEGIIHRLVARKINNVLCGLL